MMFANYNMHLLWFTDGDASQTNKTNSYTIIEQKLTYTAFSLYGEHQSQIYLILLHATHMTVKPWSYWSDNPQSLSSQPHKFLLYNTMSIHENL